MLNTSVQQLFEAAHDLYAGTSPLVGNSPGRTIPLNTGPKIYGLPEAIRRLEALERLEEE